MRISGRFWWQSERRIDPELDVAVWQLVVREAEEGLETLRAAITNAAWAVDPRWAVVSGD